MVTNRESWVDNVKIIACMLVLLGHFYQSMIKANILPASDFFYWFNTTIYYFHVPLFFICSGYIYQSYSKVTSFEQWKENIIKKAITLGVPYFVFSFVTWLLKSVFANSVNDKVGGLFHTLFVAPVSSYWYLYALFFIFVVTPTFSNKRMTIIGIFIALLLKALVHYGRSFYLLSYLLSNEIWFVLGMSMAITKRKTLGTNFDMFLFIVFIVASIVFFDFNNASLSFLLGTIACASIIDFVRIVSCKSEQNLFLSFLAKYTMSIFLMHTLFAASMRVVLLKLGFVNPIVHITLGIGISAIGPIVMAVLMKRTKYLEFFLNPGKFVNLK